MHTIFAIHYAHDFYLAVAKHQDGGLDFPKTVEPTYPEFIYFSYVCGTSAQTADVNITSRSMRILNTLHIRLAYGFNTTILAICINVAASFIWVKCNAIAYPTNQLKPKNSSQTPF